MLVIAGLICSAVLLPAAHAQQCSLTTVAGSYGYTFSGFVSPAANLFVPAAAAGLLALDGHGNLTGTQTRVVASSPLDETFTGTYTVNPDCTGSLTLLVQPDTRTSTVKVVWTNTTKSISAVFTTPGFTLTGTATRIGFIN
jgi:hypothetical protein